MAGRFSELVKRVRAEKVAKQRLAGTWTTQFQARFDDGEAPAEVKPEPAAIDLTPKYQVGGNHGTKAR